MIALRKALDRIADEIKNTDADGSEPDWIACHVLKCGRAALRLKREVSDSEFDEMLAIAVERATGKPLAQVLGYTQFYGLDIEVNGDVLCPRPETELLVEQALIFLNDKKNARVLDMCTGSGCIAVALKALSNRSADVTASDVSERALETAKRNAEKNGADITFVLSDVFENVQGKFDLITTNPPYIPSADIDGLDREVKEFEPHIALDGGRDGLDFYRIIAENAAEYLNDGGALIAECGAGQAAEIINMLKGFDCRVVKDLQGIERIVKAVKTGV